MLEGGLEWSARYWVGDSGCAAAAPGASPGLACSPSSAAVLAMAGSPRGEEVGILK